jgi:sugar phosphate isomerase/epimerase
MDKKLTRRGLVGAAAGTAAATTLGPLSPIARGQGAAPGAALLPRANIGIQLWTVRDQVANLGFDAVFARLAAMGYKEVEFAGYNAQGRRWSNQELRGLLAKYGLRAIGSHVGYTGGYSFTSSLQQVLTDAAEIGMPYIGTASSPGDAHGQSVDGYKAAAEDFNKFGAAARAMGLKFYQHNHYSEFEVQNGTRLFNVVVENTDPRLVFFEQDIFWAHVGQAAYPGFRPHEYPWNMPERFPLFHVKDGFVEAVQPGSPSGWKMTDVGAGDIAFEPYFCGLDTRDHQFLMENDDAAQEVGGSFADAERSYDYMASLRVRHPSTT